MVDLAVERISDLAVVECDGRIIASEDGFKLRKAVTSLTDARIIVLDLSEVRDIEASSLGMLLFLQRWAYDRDIQLKVFNPARSVRDRLERAGAMPDFDFATLPEMMALLAKAGGYEGFVAEVRPRIESDNDIDRATS